MRNLLTVTAVALALSLGAVQQAKAECGVVRDAAGVVVIGGSAAAISMAGEGLGTTLIGNTVVAGFAGPALGLIAFGLYNNYCSTGSMWTAPASQFVNVVSKVPATDFATRQFVDASYKTRLGL